MTPRRLLYAAGLAALGATPTVAGADPNNTTRIAFYDGPGTSSADALDNFYATLVTAADSAFGGPAAFTLTNISVPGVQALSRSDFDIAVFPGGSGNGQATAIGDQGIAAVRAFHAAGGGYIGTCGGAYLGLSHIKFYGDPPPPTQEPWDRGHGPVQVEFSAEGDTDLGLNYTGNITIVYWQGPIVKTADFPPAVRVLATFRSEIHSNHPNETTGEMVNTPAITALDSNNGTAGRVVLNSPHPEIKRADGTNLPGIYAGELAWIRAKQVAPPSPSPAPAPPAGVVRVGLYDGPGVGNSTTHTDAHNVSRTGLGWFEVTLREAGAAAFGAAGFALTELGPAQVQQLARDDYDVVVFPGGSGNGQAKGVGPKGLKAIQEFVAAGGGYIGTCGGAFLALQHALLYGSPAPKTQEPFDRGHGDVVMEVEQATPLGFNATGNVSILYWQGPVVKPADFRPDVQVLAMFRTEIHTNHPNETTGEMVNTPAITAVDTGGADGAGGRVVLNSPHPELPRAADGIRLPNVYAGELLYIREKQLRQLRRHRLQHMHQQQHQLPL